MLIQEPNRVNSIILQKMSHYQLWQHRNYATCQENISSIQNSLSFLFFFFLRINDTRKQIKRTRCNRHTQDYTEPMDSLHQQTIKKNGRKKMVKSGITILTTNYTKWTKSILNSYQPVPMTLCHIKCQKNWLHNIK